MSEPTFLLRETVEFLHDEAIRLYGGNPGILDANLLESSVHRAPNKYIYGGDHTDLYDLAAAYAFAFAKNYAFYDGNKRTAWVSCVLFLRTNGTRINATVEAAVAITLDLANDAISETDFAYWLRKRATSV